MSYNAQTAVDSKHCLIVHYENTNVNDRKALSRVAIETKIILEKESIERSQYAEAVETNSQRLSQEKEKYKLRQQIVEHPFGTIKRQWGFDYVLLKGLKKNEADFGLIFSVYNLRRVLSILGIPELKKRLCSAFISFLLLLRYIKFYIHKIYFYQYSDL